MATKVNAKREFLENPKYSNSWYKLIQDDYDNSLELTLADCSRSITWYFGKPGTRRGKAKIAKVKKIVDFIYDYYHKEG